MASQLPFSSQISSRFKFEIKYLLKYLFIWRCLWKYHRISESCCFEYLRLLENYRDIKDDSTWSHNIVVICEFISHVYSTCGFVFIGQVSVPISPLLVREEYGVNCRNFLKKFEGQPLSTFQHFCLKVHKMMYNYRCGKEWGQLIPILFTCIKPWARLWFHIVYWFALCFDPWLSFESLQIDWKASLYR